MSNGNIVSVIEAGLSSVTFKMTDFGGRSKELKPVIEFKQGNGKYRSLYVAELQFVLDNAATFKKALDALKSAAQPAKQEQPAAAMLANMDSAAIAQLLALLQGGAAQPTAQPDDKPAKQASKPATAQPSAIAAAIKARTSK